MLCSLDSRIQKRIINIIGLNLARNLQSLSHRHNIASLSLFYKYYHCNCSVELKSLVSSNIVLLIKLLFVRPGYLPFLILIQFLFLPVKKQYSIQTAFFLELLLFETHFLLLAFLIHMIFSFPSLLLTAT